MKNMEKPRTKYAAGLAIPLTVNFVGSFFKWWSWDAVFRWIWQGIITALTWLGAYVSAPRWLVGLLALLSMVFLILLLLKIIRIKGFPTAWDYTLDFIEGLKWRWKFGKSGNIPEIGAFCPVCDHALIPKAYKEYRYGDSEPKVDFYCENCSSSIAIHSGFTDEIENKVRRHIQRKIRSGEWKEAVAKYGFDR